MSVSFSVGLGILWIGSFIVHFRRTHGAWDVLSELNEKYGLGDDAELTMMIPLIGTAIGIIAYGIAIRRIGKDVNNGRLARIGLFIAIPIVNILSPLWFYYASKAMNEVIANVKNGAWYCKTPP